MTRETRERLATLEADLLAVKPRRLFSSASWTTDVPRLPGVYVIWALKPRRPLYVGQTSDLRARMSDLGRYENHTCRRKLSELLGVGREDEQALSAAIAKSHDLSVMAVEFGRTELEEYLRVRWRESLINSAGPRQLGRFVWVEPTVPAS